MSSTIINWKLSSFVEHNQSIKYNTPIIRHNYTEQSVMLIFRQNVKTTKLEC